MILKKLFTKRKRYLFPATIGEIKTNVPLAKKTWMGVGGAAEFTLSLPMKKI